MDSGGGGDRFPQWSVQETRDFLMLRAELDPTFMETKRNKVLWEVISSKMKERGYNRSGEQCKCKWKNLVTRYKGFETMEQEGMRQQFPFYNELQAIFTGRMQRMLWLEAEGGSSKKRLLSSDDEDEESDVDKASKKKKKISNKDSSTLAVNLKEILDDLMKQHMQIEMQWMKLYESKEEERRRRDMEWRQKMEALENEKIMFDRRWREREEERRIREETRSEKRDALITILLDKLRPQD
ncbi:putative transcription factor MYB family [Helianthus annuus]|uniref:Putative SANT/Myb domain, C2H2-zinc finger protein family n=1 Tax=Helianthus annuus TaxID=4232 RepID=A0A251TJS2_HELAN|nr:trihelix transcription factor GT-3b [Helianthus annuus]KAF5785632.1 putative transcription factor MYB family [Helianthus annuus]KAJ0513160.1 putative transcription factor MYB family [Helianthus annuus]KAJ0520909.1 putative transcription factor MYB family [Helianthus annuus]KAJ0529284.1 putative transcription factor MYB family [Helianthus annuus]KAJ0696166.1 putative transcription factor MYB family [Helianthus annuus]